MVWNRGPVVGPNGPIDQLARSNAETAADTAVWGGITGVVADQTDLAPYVDERARDAVGAALQSDGTIDITPNDPGNTVSVVVNTTAEAERIRDIIGAALVAGTDISIAVNDGANTITINSTSVGKIWGPVVDGSFPPVFIQNPDGSLVLAEHV